MKKLSLIAILSVSLTTLFSCKRTLDVNNNPNAPANVTVKELLPSAEASIGQVMGNYFTIVGGIWSQYWTQNPNASQYRPYEQYQLAPSTTNNAWAELYAGALTDLKKIVEKADTAENTKNYTAVAKILQAYTFQVLTDQFGDIPFSQALLGEDRQITSPKYDRQEDVYKGIIKLLQDAQNLIDPNVAGPGSEDLVYAGDMVKWYKFSNTLMLRAYLRLVYVNPGLAQQGITAMSQDPLDYINETETGQISYIKDPGNTNPLYSEMVNLNRTQNLVASSTAIDSLNARGDVRIDAFYFTSGASYVGLLQGYYSIQNPGSYSLPGALVGGIANPSIYNSIDPTLEVKTATAPVKFLSSYESYFLLAEAAARGWFSGATAQDLYEAAITANYTEYGFTVTDATDYITNVAPYPNGGLNTNLKAIITEKWYAMCGNENIEAWTEWRRTGFPNFFVLSFNSKTKPLFPGRLPYPETEITRNLNFPGQKLVTDKVWWDVN